MRPITKSAVAAFSSHFEITPNIINNGHCFNFAYFIYLLLDATHSLTLYSTHTNGGHAFLKINGKFYDSDTLQGVADWRQLRPIWDTKVKDTDAYPLTAAKFLTHWNVNTHKVHSLANAFQLPPTIRALTPTGYVKTSKLLLSKKRSNTSLAELAIRFSQFTPTQQQFCYNALNCVVNSSFPRLRKSS